MCENGNDLATLAASFELTLGSMRSAHADLVKQVAQLAKPPATPVWYRPIVTVTVPASGFAVVEVGGPDPGHFWYLRRWTASGLTPGTAAAGIADLFISASNLTRLSTAADIGAGDWVDEFPTLPNISDYGGGSYPVQAQEAIFVALRGATAGQQYVVTAGVTDFELSGAKQDWAL